MGSGLEKFHCISNHAILLSEDGLSKSPDYNNPNTKDFQTSSGQQVPKSLATCCSEPDKLKTKSSHSLMIEQRSTEQRNNHAATTDVDMSAASLSSMTLLPDGVVRIKEAHARDPRYQPNSQQTLQQSDLSKRPQSGHNRPKVQMTRLSAGLRETKPNSLRMIKDPEEVLRQKRKLMSGATQTQYSPYTETTSPTSHHLNRGQENSSSRKLLSKSESGAKDKRHHVGRKARPPSPSELIDIEDESFDNLDDAEDFKLKLEESLKKVSRYRVTKKGLEETGISFSDVTTDESQNQEFSNGREIVNIHHGDLKESLSSIENEVQKMSKHKLHETTPDITIHGQDKQGDGGQEVTKTKTKDKKDKKKKSKKPFKWLYKINSAKISPLNPPEKDTAHTQQRSKADLEKIAAMFCVETPAQAGLRKLLNNNDYAEDGEDRFIKPGVWDCNIGHNDGPGKRNVKVADNHPVKSIEDGLGDMDFNNNSPTPASKLRTGFNKVEAWLRQIFKDTQ